MQLQRLCSGCKFLELLKAKTQIVAAIWVDAKRYFCGVCFEISDGRKGN